MIDPSTAGEWDDDDGFHPYAPPDWYVAMRACRYVGEPFCGANRIAYGPIVEAWALAAESAEHEAEAELHRRARQR